MNFGNISTNNTGHQTTTWGGGGASFTFNRSNDVTIGVTASKIRVKGKEYSGKVKIFVEEELVDEFSDSCLKIEISGDAPAAIDIKGNADVNVHGSTGRINLVTGDVSVDGDVDDSVIITTGDAKIGGNVTRGDVKVTTGSIKCRNVTSGSCSVNVGTISHT